MQIPRKRGTYTVLVKKKGWSRFFATTLCKQNRKPIATALSRSSRLYYREVRDCIIAKFANSVNTYANTYGHRSCAHFVNFANVSTRIARTFRERMLLASLREVFACALLPFFDKYRTCQKWSRFVWDQT